MYRTLHQPPREKQSLSTFMITVWALKEGKSRCLSTYSKGMRQGDLESWKAPGRSECLARKRKQLVDREIRFLCPSLIGANGALILFPAQIQEEKKALSQRGKGESHWAQFKLQLLKNQKLVLEREDGAYCERAILITSPQSQGILCTKAEGSLGPPADVEGTALSEPAKQTQHIFIDLIPHFFLLTLSWQFSSENAIQVPGVHNTCKHSTTKPNQTMQKSTISFHTKMRITSWKYEEYLPHQPFPSPWQQVLGSLQLPSQLEHSRHWIAWLCHTSLARLILSHLDNELCCSLDWKAASR